MMLRGRLFCARLYCSLEIQRHLSFSGRLEYFCAVSKPGQEMTLFSCLRVLFEYEQSRLIRLLRYG